MVKPIIQAVIIGDKLYRPIFMHPYHNIIIPRGFRSCGDLMLCMADRCGHGLKSCSHDRILPISSEVSLT